MLVEEVGMLSELLRRYEREYFVDARPTKTDSEYDRLLDRLQAIEEEYPSLRMVDSPTNRVGSSLSSDLPEVEHTIPVLSLDKVNTPTELEKWLQKIPKDEHSSLDFTIEEKIDGVSLILYYEDGVLVRGVSRGNGVTGNDITSNVMTIPSIPIRLPKSVTVAVRGEVYLPTQHFQDLNRKLELPYANPRNLAAGTLRRIKSREVAQVPLNIFVYEGFFTPPYPSHLESLEELRSLGFRLNPDTTTLSIDGGSIRINGESSNGIEGLRNYLQRYIEIRDRLPYEIDGLVFKVNQLNLREKLGYTGHHPRWAIAYKFESPLGEGRLLSVEVQVGRSGRITPVGRITPTQIGGSTISNVTLHNQQYIEMLELAIGDTVTIARRGDVIPAVERVVGKNQEGNSIYQIPANCPTCGSPLVLSGAHHFCPNSDCLDQIVGRLIFFAGRNQMDIEGLGAETIATMVNIGVIRDIPDLYTADLKPLLNHPGFGEKKISAIVEGIEQSRTKPFRTLLVSLGIPSLGQKCVERVIGAGINSLDLLLSVVDEKRVDRLVEIEGVGEKTAELIIEELSRPDARARIEGLREAGLLMEEPTGPVAGEAILTGQVWCITGSFQHFDSRSAIEDTIQHYGGRTVSAITGKTTHLLAGTGGGGKREKAVALGVTIVTEEELLELLPVEEGSPQDRGV